MTKKKLIRFTENLSFPFLFQPSFPELQRTFRLKGHWHTDFFQNDHPITLELGCGKGEYTVGLASQFPERNFIGVDIKGSRLWKGCKTVQENKLTNVAFIRTRIDQIEQLFHKAEVSEIWITFPDPQPGKERKRLTSPMFLERYRQILSPSGIVHLKTDDPDLFDYTREILHQKKADILTSISDLYKTNPANPAAQIRTFYENRWLDEGRLIYYIQFRLPY